MKNQADAGVCSYAATAMSTYLLAMENEVEGVRQSKDVEHVHRMRVAARRLRSTLPLFSQCFGSKKLTTWLDELRSMAQALGSARDTDVQLLYLDECIHQVVDPHQLPGIRRLHMRLTQKRGRIQQKVLLELDAFEKKGTLQRITQALNKLQAQLGGDVPYSAALYRVAHDSIQDYYNGLAQWEPFIDRPENVTELHQMRVAMKRLRYSMETFAVLYPDRLSDAIRLTKKHQDLLGSIHDYDIWLDALPVFVEKEEQRIFQYFNNTRPMKRLVPGLTALADHYQTEREDTYRRFVHDWKRDRASPLWNHMLATIRTPLTILGQPDSQG